MDLQNRKILFIQEFLKLENENAISRLEMVLKETQTVFTSGQMRSQQFPKRIDEPSEDSKSRRLPDTDDLLSQIDKLT